jgi:hypothetical protein
MVVGATIEYVSGSIVCDADKRKVRCGLLIVAVTQQGFSLA